MSSIITHGLADLPSPNYEYVTTTTRALEILPEIKRYNIIEFDTETTSLDTLTARVVLIQIGVIGRVFVFDVRDGRVDAQIFKDILEGDAQLKLIQNAVYDYKVMKVNFGIEINRIYDTMIAEQLLYLGLHPKANLGHLVAKYLHMNMPKDIATSFHDYSQEYQEYQLRYAANDVCVLRSIYELQLPKLRTDGLMQVAKLEFDFIKPLCEMELNGMLLDVPRWRSMLEEKIVERDRIRIQLGDVLEDTVEQQTLFGVSLMNLNSPAQVVAGLNRLGIPVESTDVKELNKYKKHSIVNQLLEYREYEKFITTYGEPMIARIHPVTGRLHTSFKQMVDTGRLSSSNPNLQNIPKEQRYRSCFIARLGYKLITADMSAAELRIIANLSKEPAWIEIFNSGEDLHTISAAFMYGIMVEEVIADKKLPDDDPKKKNYRGNSKAISFGLCVDEDSVLFTNGGICKIKDVGIESVSAHDVGYNRIIDKKCIGEKEVFSVTSRFGYQLNGTLDHFVKVINKDGEYADKKIQDLDIETDYVCLKKGSNLFNSDLFIFNNFEVIKRTNYKEFDLPTTLNSAWASFLGLFVSEGNLSKVRGRDKFGCIQFTFSNNDLGFIECIHTLFINIFGDRYSNGLDKKFDRTHFSINSVLLGEWVKSLFNEDIFIDKSASIDVPMCIKISPKDIQASFLRWLFEGDGSIKKNGRGYKITYCSKSNKLVRDVQLMLLNFGILSSITEEYREGYPGLYYTLSIVGDGGLFEREIGFVSVRKNSRFINTSTYRESCYSIPNQHTRLLEIKSNNTFSRKDRRIYDTIYNCIKYTDGRIGDVLLDRLDIYNDFIAFINKNDIVPLPIKSIKSIGKKNVYDLSIENHQYFLANGFIVHNCYGLTKVGLALRLGISENAAQDLIDKYYRLYPTVISFLEESAKEAVLKGYTTSISGRRRYYARPNPSNSSFKKVRGSVERQGKNMKIQAGNADTIKQAMIYVLERIKPYDARLLLTVHDEIIVEVREDQAQEVKSVVERSIIDGFGEFFKLVPMSTEALVGDCWLKG